MSTLDSLPDVLVLNKNYEPIEWANYREYAIKHSKGDIIASLSQTEVVLHGGTNARTGLQSVLVMDSIVVVDSSISPYKYRKSVPILSNNALFKRDFNMCVYCGLVFNESKLTREHVIPISKGGLDIWTNVATCCKGCNNYKDSMSVEQAGLQLLYLPYVPHPEELFLLSNKRILADQMEFLLNRLPDYSRLHKHFN